MQYLDPHDPAYNNRYALRPSPFTYLLPSIVCIAAAFICRSGLMALSLGRLEIMRVTKA